jgi:tetratricopeptide (TPR) repeat protein
MMKMRCVALLAAASAAVLAACSTVPGTGTGTGSGPTISLGTEQRSAAGTYLSGNFAASQGDLKAAAEFFSKSLADDPANKELLTRAFLYTATSGDMRKAIELSDRVIAAEPDNRAARLIRAVARLQKGDYAAARDETSKSASGPFSQLTNAFINAWAYEGEGNTDEALKALEYLSSQGGLQGMHAFAQALILDHAGRVDEADKAYRRAIGMTPGPRSIEAYGRFLERQGRHDDAIALYTALQKDNPANPISAYSLARARAKGRVESVAATPASGAAESLFNIAASLNDERSGDVAILYLNLVLHLNPNFEVARVLLADRYENDNMFEAANAIYARVPSSSPYYGMVRIETAMNLARMGEDEKALVELRRIAESRNGDTEAWTALGDLYRNKEKFAEAAAAYDKAIKAIGDPPPPSRWSLFYARGVALERAGRWDEAERDLKQALALSPDQASVLNYLGYSWVDQGKNLDEALAMLEKATALRPMDGYIADSVGWAYYKLGRYKEAAAALERAVLLAPGDPTINDHLGDAYWRVGRKEDARFQWSHALAMKPDEKDKPLIQHKLEHGLDAATAAVPPSGL